MTTLTYNDILAVLLLVFYTPALAVAAQLMWRHGWRASYETWFTILLFCVSRLAYAALQLATMAHPSSTGLRIAAATFAVDGLSPLLFSAMGFLRRALRVLEQKPGVENEKKEERDSGEEEAKEEDRVETKAPKYLTPPRLWLIEAIITAAMICASVGNARLSRADVLAGSPHYGSSYRASAILYLVGFAGIVVATAIVVRDRAHVEDGERRVLLAVLLSLPFLCLRTLYLALGVLGDIKACWTVGGDETAFLCLALLEETVVVAGFLGVGVGLRVLKVGKEGHVDGGRDAECGGYGVRLTGEAAAAAGK